MGEEMKFCVDCRRETSVFADHSQGLICTECGLVVDENNVDTTQDVRIFEDNIGAKRVEEADPSGNGEIAATVIQFSGTNPEAILLKRCQRMQSKNMKDDKLKSAHAQIADFASTLRISDHVTEHAQRIYDQFTDYQNNAHNIGACTGLRMRGKKHKALLVGCLYHAGNQLEQPKSLEEFASGTDLSKKEISHARKIIQQQTNNVNIEENDGKTQSLVEAAVPAVSIAASNGPKPHHLVKAEVSRICSRLQFSFRDRKCAEEIADTVRRTLDIRKAPNSQAAAIVWICLQLLLSPELHKKLKPEFLHVISVSLGTLRQTYSLFLPHLPKILPRDRFGELHDWENKLQRP